MRLGQCFQLVSTTRYGLLRRFFSFTRWKPKVQSLQRPQKNGQLGGDAQGCTVGEPTLALDAALEGSGDKLTGTLAIGGATVHMTRQ